MNEKAYRLWSLILEMEWLKILAWTDLEDDGSDMAVAAVARWPGLEMATMMRLSGTSDVRVADEESVFTLFEVAC